MGEVEELCGGVLHRWYSDDGYELVLTLCKYELKKGIF